AAEDLERGRAAEAGGAVEVGEGGGGVAGGQGEGAAEFHPARVVRVGGEARLDVLPSPVEVLQREAHAGADEPGLGRARVETEGSGGGRLGSGVAQGGE